MAWSVILVDANNPAVNVTYTDENVEGLNYDDEPGGFRSIIGSVAKTLEFTNKATSATSHNFTTGSKTFSKVGGFGFASGSAVRLADVAGTSYMDGLVTAIDHTTNLLTINVLSVGAGSGANGSWVITLGTSVSTIVSTPVSIANGGTAGATAAAARTNLEVGRLFRILGVLSTPPGSPTNGDTYLVGNSPTGAYVGHEHEIAIYSSGWTFTAAVAGDFAYDSATAVKDVYVFTGTAQATEGIYVNSHWKELTPQRPRWVSGATKTNNFTVTTADHGKWFAISQASNIQVTITSSVGNSAAAGMEFVCEVNGLNAFTVTFVLSDASNFRLANGTTAASIVVPASTYQRLHFVTGNSNIPTENGCYVFEKSP